MEPTWNGNEGMTEASDLGLLPGRWPTQVAAEGPDGRTHSFVRSSEIRASDGEFAGYEYRLSRWTLKVFND